MEIFTVLIQNEAKLLLTMNRINLLLDGMFLIYSSSLACTRANIENDFPCFAANGMIQGCYPPEMLTGLHVIAKVAYQWKDMTK